MIQVYFSERNNYEKYKLALPLLSQKEVNFLQLFVFNIIENDFWKIGI